jgi:hypothetical protein
MNNTQRTCLVKGAVYFVICICVTKTEFQQLFATLYLTEIFAATNPWLKNE